MEKGTKIIIGFLGTVAAVTLGVMAVRFFKRKKEDNLTIEIGTVDWANKRIPYVLKSNGSQIASGTTSWESANVGKGELPIIKDTIGKNELTKINLTNGLVLSARSMGVDKASKIIDFNSKKVKDFSGNAANAVAAATQTLSNMFM